VKKILTYLLVLIAIIVLIVTLFFDTLTKGVIESYAQKILKTQVSISEFRSDLSAGKVNLDFVEVKNPAIFKNENAFVLNHLSLIVSDESNDDLIVLEQLEFDGLLFNLEQNNQQINLVTLLKNLEQTPTNSNNNVVEDRVIETKEQSETRVIIKELKFVNAQLKIDTQWFNDTVIVPDVLIYNFGAQNGIPIHLVGAELMKIALGRIQKEVENKGLRLGEKEIKAGIRKKLEGELKGLKGELNDKAKGWLNRLGL
jgi:hypothetical protein